MTSTTPNFSGLWMRAWPCGGSIRKQMTPDQIFGAMAESMNSMLLNLQAAMAEAPDDLAAEQVSEIIKAAEELRAQIDSAMQAAADKPVDESQPDGSSVQEIDS